MIFACFPDWDQQVHLDMFVNVQNLKPQNLLLCCNVQI